MGVKGERERKFLTTLFALYLLISAPLAQMEGGPGITLFPSNLSITIWEGEGASQITSRKAPDHITLHLTRPSVTSTPCT